MQDAGDSGAEQRRTCATQALEAAASSLATAVDVDSRHTEPGGEARVKELALATLASVDVFDRGASAVSAHPALESWSDPPARGCLTQKTSTTPPATRSEAARSASVALPWRFSAAWQRQRRR